MGRAPFSVAAPRGPVLDWGHVFDRMAHADAHGCHVPLRHAVPLPGLTTTARSPAASTGAATPSETSHDAPQQPHGIPPAAHRPAPDRQCPVSAHANAHCDTPTALTTWSTTCPSHPRPPGAAPPA